MPSSSDNQDTLQVISYLVELQEKKLVTIKERVLGRDYTTFAIGGPLKVLIEPQNEEGLLASLMASKATGQIYKVLGAGSNILINDDGIEDWVFKLGRGFRYCEQIKDTLFKVGGSYSLMSLSRELSQAGFSGLEFAGGIPASLGGAIFMNAGAHASEIGQVVQSVRVALPDGRVEEICGSKINWSYRKSNLPKDCIVLDVLLKLTESDKVITNKKRTECLEYRKSTQPLAMPSAGSIFKNPSAQQSAGFLIEKVGLKGQVAGHAMISEKHANWIVNPGKNAQASDVRQLIQLCQSKVHESFNVELEAELVCW